SRAEPFIAPGFTDHNPPPFPDLAPGLEGFRQGFSYGLSAFSDFQHTIEDQITEGDKVVTRVTASGVHTGDFLGIPPTGKRVTMTGIDLYRIAGGKIAEEWAEPDVLGPLQQLGVIPAPGQTQ